MEQKCANCGNGKWRDGVTPITETCCECKYVDKGALVPQPSNWIPKVQTNADRIRATDDELAVMIHAVKLGYAPWCDHHCENEGEDGCDNCIKKWLQQPVEGE